MGYEVHITRGDWWEDDSENIEPEEWTEVVDGDTALTLTGKVSETTPAGETLTSGSKLMALWTGHPSGEPVPFHYRDGGIVVKNPDDDVIQKMIEVASALGAAVQGDEGESYPG